MTLLSSKAVYAAGAQRHSHWCRSMRARSVVTPPRAANQCVTVACEDVLPWQNHGSSESYQEKLLLVKMKREESTQNTTVTKSAASVRSKQLLDTYICYIHHQTCKFTIEFITGQNEREETTQDTIVTKSAACASYEINYLTYITARYTRAKRRWHGATAHVPPRNEGQRLSLGPYRVPVQCPARRPY